MIDIAMGFSFFLLSVAFFWCCMSSQIWITDCVIMQQKEEDYKKQKNRKSRGNSKHASISRARPYYSRKRLIAGPFSHLLSNLPRFSPRLIIIYHLIALVISPEQAGQRIWPTQTSFLFRRKKNDYFSLPTNVMIIISQKTFLTFSCCSWHRFFFFFFKHKDFT